MGKNNATKEKASKGPLEGILADMDRTRGSNGKENGGQGGTSRGLPNPSEKTEPKPSKDNSSSKGKQSSGQENQTGNKLTPVGDASDPTAQTKLDGI